MMIKKTNPHRQNPNKLTRSKVSDATGLLISSIILTVPISAMAGETIVYPGDQLVTISGVANSLGPSGSDTGKSNSLSGNSVTVNGGVTVGGIVVGAIGSDTDEVKDNQVFINSNAQVNGSIAGGTNLFGDVRGNSVSFEGVIAQNIYGGLTYAGASIRNSVSITGGGS